MKHRSVLGHLSRTRREEGVKHAGREEAAETRDTYWAGDSVWIYSMS